MGDHFKLGFAHQLGKFHQSQNTVPSLYPQRSPSDEIINWGPVCMSMQKDHVHTFKIQQSMCRVQWILETLKHPVCTVGWVPPLRHSCLSPEKATWISHRINPNGILQLKKKKKNQHKSCSSESHLIEKQLPSLLLAKVHLLDSHLTAISVAGDTHNSRWTFPDLHEVVKETARIPWSDHHLESCAKLYRHTEIYHADYSQMVIFTSCSTMTTH